MFIESIHNNIIKQVISLQNKKYRDELGLFMVEGIKQVDEISKKYKIEYIVCTKENEIVSKDFKTYTTTESIFNKISDTKTPQGIIAILKKPTYNIENILQNSGIFVVLDCLQDPGNMGSIIRSCSAYNCKGIFVSKNSVDVFSPKVVRSTMGTFFDVPIIQDIDIIKLLEKFKQYKITSYALALQTNNLLSKTKFENNSAFIIGNESKGISNDVLKKADKLIKIEMLGKTQSLNAAIACSIALYVGANNVYYNR